MYLEIEIEKDRGREKKYVTLKLEEDTHKIKMKFDRKPDFEVPDFIMLGKRRSRAKRKVSSGSKGFFVNYFVLEKKDCWSNMLVQGCISVNCVGEGGSLEQLLLFIFVNLFCEPIWIFKFII